jgi:integrase
MRSTAIGIWKKHSKSYDGLWWMSYTTADGKSHQVSTKTRIKREAAAIYAVRKAQILAGTWDMLEPSAPKLGEWSEKFLASVRTPSTQTRYRASMKRLLQFFDVRTPISSISVRSIEDYKAERLREVGAATLNRDLSVLRILLRLATRQRFIARNPFDSIDMADERSVRKEPTILGFSDEAKILEHASPYLRTAITVLVETGLRPKKECLSLLEWGDIDFETDTLTVRQSKSRAGRRSLPLSSHCRAALTSWRSLTKNASTFVFFNPSNPSKPIGSVKKAWSTALKRAGLEYRPIYSLRSTFASRLGACGVPDHFIGQLLGHRGGLISVYSKATDEFRRDAIRKLDELRAKSQSTQNCPHLSQIRRKLAVLPPCFRPSSR